MRIMLFAKRNAPVILLLLAGWMVAATVVYLNGRHPSASTAPSGTEESVGSDDRVPLTTNVSLPIGACSMYGELRGVNFLHKSLKHKICKGAAAYAITDNEFPLCELQDQLPHLLTDPVKLGSFATYIHSPVTHRNVSCFVYSSPDLISKEIRGTHIFEEDNVRTMMKIVLRLNASSAVTFVDIGSNIGVFALTALDLGVPVVALDANIRNLLRIKLSAEAHGVSHRLRLLWNFVSTRVSLMYLNFPQDCNIGGATKFGRAVTDTIPVMSSGADSIVTKIATQTVVMKVDIEGGECEFFKSAEHLFNSFTIPAVHMEWLKRHMTEDERQFMVKFFLQRRYSARNIHDLRKKIDIEDPNFNGDELIWLRKDFLEKGVFNL